VARQWNERLTDEQRDAFNFVTILYSIILGLAVTRLFDWIGDLLSSGTLPTFYLLHIAWAPIMFMLYAMLWFSTWIYRSRIVAHRFLDYCLSLSAPTSTYVATAVLFPRGHHNDWSKYYFTHSAVIFGALAAAHVTFVLVGTFVGGDRWLGPRNGVRYVCIAALCSLAIFRAPWWHGAAVVWFYLLFVSIGLKLTIDTRRKAR
jgi:hypothetical protein